MKKKVNNKKLVLSLSKETIGLVKGGVSSGDTSPTTANCNNGSGNPCIGTAD